ncbi:origin recognition complex subunit 4 [Taxawa tesnikishii (nom. ined.)]|nr:origin recognition complex subunit 4 [Dothideales sp. JES 119]
MESPRSAKRRKLDTPAQSSPKAASTPVRSSNRKPKPTAKLVASSPAVSSSAATNGLRRVERKSLGNSRNDANGTTPRKTINGGDEIDVYDDFDGAHTAASVGKSAWKKSAAKAAEEHDNNKHGTAAVQHPVQWKLDKAVRSARKRKERPQKTDYVNEKSDRQPKGSKAQDTIEIDDTEEMITIDATDNEEELAPSPTLKSVESVKQGFQKDQEAKDTATAASPSQQKPKMTFEDQIKQIEEEARKVSKGDIVQVVEPEAMDVDSIRGETIETAAVAPTQATTIVPTYPDTKMSSSLLETLQTIILGKLTGRKRCRLIGLDDEYAKVVTLVEQTISAGESNTMLLIGARGSGKSAVVDQIIEEQTERHGEDFHIVRLSGFIHTDDKIALREIWRQLGKEMEIEEDGIGKNYADTLTTLLALLSHSSEIAGQETTDQVTKSIIFILDEFELFASHPRQTLLYNLFDIAQSRKAPIAVLGLTTRFDVAESLEKRVKSRFSHRYVHLSLAKNFADFSKMCQSALTIYPEDVLELDSMPVRGRNKALDRDTELDETYQAWNQQVGSLFSLAPFADQLRRIYYTSKSVPAFHTAMLPTIATLPSNLDTSQHNGGALSAHAVATHLSQASRTMSLLSPPDSKLSLLPSLSDLQLALLVAAARLSLIHDADSCTFALAYDEYKTLASKARIQASAGGAVAGAAARVWGKEVARGAWEGLLELGLVLPVEGRRQSGDAALCRVDVGLEEIGMSGVELGTTMAKWCREI